MRVVITLSVFCLLIFGYLSIALPVATLQSKTAECECQSPDLAKQRQQELDSYTYEIEHQKALLYSYQKTSYEALQQVEVLQNRVQYLKAEEARVRR